MKFNILSIFIIASIVFFINARCPQNVEDIHTVDSTNDQTETAPQKQIILTISIEEARFMIESEKNNPNFKIIDVRTPSEYRSGLIDGAINIDYNSSNFKTALADLSKSNKYLIYCRSGNRSASALALMKDMGFLEVYNMSGGIIYWSANNYPLTSF